MIFNDMGKGGKSFMEYISDIILIAKSPEQMETHFRQFLDMCSRHSVVLKWTKRNLVRKDNIKILGFSISEGKLKPQQTR